MNINSEIIAALIGFAATIFAAIIALLGVVLSIKYKKELKSYAGTSFVRFIAHDEDFRELLSRVDSIFAYTVNSHEIFNKLNTILEQNPNLSIRNFTLLVRKKPDEKPEDIDILNRIIALWERLVEEKRIKNLVIISYDHDPDHYYTLFGRRLVFCGQVLFDETRPTGTKVDYLPLVFENTNKLGKQVIKNYQHHFNNVVERYKNTSTLFPYSTDQ